jgi:RNA recognition motif-containing protein
LRPDQQKTQDREGHDLEAEAAKHVSSSGLEGQQTSQKRTSEAPKIKIPPNETVYIGNLFYDITAEDLRKHMEKYGTVLHTMIVHDNRGLSKG